MRSPKVAYVPKSRDRNRGPRRSPGMVKHFISALALPAFALAACSAPPIANQTATPADNTIDAINIVDPEPDNAVAPADANTLTSTGLGALRIGMTRAELVAAAGGSTATNADPQACEQFHPARAPAGVLVRD